MDLHVRALKLCARRLLVTFLSVVCAVGIAQAGSLVHAAPAPVFQRNLSVGSEGVDVQQLQRYLNERGFAVAASGPGSAGQETTRFGVLTRLALVRFQEAHAADVLLPAGLSRGTGNFFTLTRAYVNAHLEDFDPVVAAAQPGGTGRFSVGGSLTGITGPVVLENNGEQLVIRPGQSSQFAFKTTLRSGASYAVRVQAAPAGQQCYMPPGESGAGVINGADVTSVHIQCTSTPGWNPFVPRVSGIPYFSVGGSVTGLTGTVVLQNNGGDNLSLSANGAFTFSRTIAVGGVYAVTVLTQPNQQTCTVSSGAGTMPVATVNTVSITCVANLPTITSLSVGNGPTDGGTNVLLTGTGFMHGFQSVKFGATPATGYFIMSDTLMTAVAPPAAVGPVHITVTTTAGTSAATSADVFTYFTLFEAYAPRMPYQPFRVFAAESVDGVRRRLGYV